MALHSGWTKDELSRRDGHPTPYLRVSERFDFEVVVGKKDHLLYQRVNGNLRKMDTQNGSGGSYIYAMDRDGNLFAAPHGSMHHSGFFAGAPGAAFGMITVHDGKIQRLDDNSGHYLPPKKSSKQILAELRARGVRVPKDDVVFKGLSKRQIAKAEAKGFPMAHERLCPDIDHLKRKPY